MFGGNGRILMLCMLSHMSDLSGRAEQGSATAESGLSLVLFTSAGDKSFSHLRTHILHTVSALHTSRGVFVYMHVIVCGGVSKKSVGTERFFSLVCFPSHLKVDVCFGVQVISDCKMLLQTFRSQPLFVQYLFIYLHVWRHEC